eukprot:4413682-Prymnesium_polylepis.1
MAEHRRRKRLQPLGELRGERRILGRQRRQRLLLRLQLALEQRHRLAAQRVLWPPHAAAALACRLVAGRVAARRAARRVPRSAVAR